MFWIRSDAGDRVMTVSDRPEETTLRLYEADPNDGFDLAAKRLAAITISAADRADLVRYLQSLPTGEEV